MRKKTMLETLMAMKLAADFGELKELCNLKITETCKGCPYWNSRACCLMSTETALITIGRYMRAFFAEYKGSVFPDTPEFVQLKERLRANTSIRSHQPTEDQSTAQPQ